MSPSPHLLRPVVFVASLLPLAALLGRGAGWIEPGLGANPIETVQDALGLWSLRLLLLTLAMTPLAMLLGRPWPIRYRRMLGLFAFSYACLHLLVYAVLDQSLYWPVLVEDIVRRPFITVGFLAVLLMLPLAVTSTAGWQRRLGRHWATLHRLIYPAAVLGVWHYWWQARADTREPLLYALVLAALLAFRLWKPLRRWIRARRNALAR